ncbi:MAG: hypothetical protein A2283_16375 [Lentisphaerae bacterium RIFOXYA12_FULL_48_11]|nr:MAG: hypothetical protein A2283_16375 [Lentisphaerae bacterium RIFOXYA12_FULL_48_11]
MKRKTDYVHSLLVTGALAIVMLMPMMSAGDESVSNAVPTMKASESKPGPLPTTYEGPGPQPKVGLSEETVAGEMWGDHSYVIPFLEVVAFEAALNIYDRMFWDEEVFDTTYKTFERNFKTTPVVDSDSFQINQLYHPYQGAMYFGFGRSAGLSYWQSLLYSIGGSELWETAGETGPPSFNDHVASGIGGSLLGEPLFRIASLVLEGGGKNPGFLRELGAACISPPTGINRLLFGERFDKVFPSHNPPTFTRLRLGMSTSVRESDNGPLTTYDRHQEMVDFLMAYGLPGKRGYTYDRPFDYFNFELSFGTGKGSFENITSRGLLYGTGYELGEAYRGLWGLFGSYDYISPQIFRVSSTAVSLGTVAQWCMTQNLVLQYSALGGVGYAAAGTISGPEERNYRYGTTPQGLLALRFIMGDLAMVDMNLREYYISDLGGSSPDGHELIRRGNIGFTVRVYGQHALGLQYTSTSRDSHALDADRHQTEEIASIVYTLLGDDNFGVVE